MSYETTTNSKLNGIEADIRPQTFGTTFDIMCTALIMP